MKLLLTTLFVVMLQNLSGQDSIRLTRQYENDRPVTRLDSFFYQVPNTIFISLDEGFNDSLHVSINDTIILRQYFITNESIGYAGGLNISFKDSSEVKILKLLFIKANKYILEKVNLNYKSLQIRGLKPWLLIYGNRFYMRV